MNDGDRQIQYNVFLGKHRCNACCPFLCVVSCCQRTSSHRKICALAELCFFLAGVPLPCYSAPQEACLQNRLAMVSHHPAASVIFCPDHMNPDKTGNKLFCQLADSLPNPPDLFMWHSHWRQMHTACCSYSSTDSLTDAAPFTPLDGLLCVSRAQCLNCFSLPYLCVHALWSSYCERPIALVVLLVRVCGCVARFL